MPKTMTGIKARLKSAEAELNYVKGIKICHALILAYKFSARYPLN